mmetsp:Transcript_22177/g.32622  ORF Transcript_22177/g.32622 Transcript_22177/m.32622 type:complete len:97 (+) Transcript_22177:1191-1481(+)
MGAYGDDGSLLLKEFDGGDGRTDTGIIGDGLSVKGNIYVTTDKNPLSLEFVSDVLNGLLGLKLERCGADSELGGRSKGGGTSDGKSGNNSSEEFHF